MPPAPGMMASRVSGRATRAEEVKIRRWVERASSRPPPKARDEMALIVGMGRLETEVRVLRRVNRKAEVLDYVRKLDLLHQVDCMVSKRKGEE